MHVPVGDLKGTDPMAYTANALSFILKNLGYKYKYHHVFQILLCFNFRHSSPHSKTQNRNINRIEEAIIVKN